MKYHRSWQAVRPWYSSFAKPKASAVEKLAASGRDWIVLDPSYGGDVKWSREDLFSIGDKKQSASHTRDILANLKPLTAAGKPALIVEYPEKPAKQAASRKLAGENNFTWLVTDLDLTILGTSGR